MKTHSQIFKDHQSSKGFTLLELLLAMSLSIVVLTLAGSGLVSIMNANQKADTATERRINLNRALDFIADEIRTGNKVSAVPSASSFPGPGTGVLLITQPPATVPTANKVYFVRSSPTNWDGPYTIYRASGTYSTASALNISSGDMLVDGISAPTTLPTCTTNGGLKGANGFYACLGADNRTVDLYLYGKLSTTNSTTYQAKTKVFARSN